MKLQNTFLGARMEKDIDERLIPKGMYPHAENIRVANSDGADVGAIENVRGNRSLTELNLTDATTIGAYADGANQKLYWFITSPTKDLVVEYDVPNKVTECLLETDKTAVDGNILKFRKDYLITGIDKYINEDINKDLLAWTDNLNPPRIINIERAKRYSPCGSPGGFTEDDISVIKKPPRKAPTITLVTSSSTGENYLENKFLAYSYRYKYLDGGYSALSSFSNYAFLPSDFDLDYETMENRGMQNTVSSVNIQFNTGSKRVTDIELVYKESNSNTIYLIETFNKAANALGHNVTESFMFTDNKVLTVLPTDELFRTYDNVPRRAKTLTLIGSRLAFGNYLEQYDLIDNFGSDIEISFSVGLINNEVSPTDSDLQQGSFPRYLFREVRPREDDPFTEVDRNIYYTGLSLIRSGQLSQGFTLNFNLNLTPVIFFQGFYRGTVNFVLTKDYANVRALGESAEFITFVETTLTEKFYEGLVYERTVDTIITDTNTRNFEIRVINGDNRLVIAPPLTTFRRPINGIETVRQIQFTFNPATTFLYTNFPTSASLKTNRGYEVGIIYLDEYNRATTVLTSVDNTIYVGQEHSTTQNQILVNIAHFPPKWADRYKIVVKQSRGDYHTIYTNVYYHEDIYTWFLLEGANRTKVREGDTLIIKNFNTSILNTVTKVRVLEIDSKDKDFIEDNRDSTDVAIKEFAGLYFKTKLDVLPKVNTNTRTHTHLSSDSRKAGKPIAYVSLGTILKDGVETDLKITVGTRINFNFNSWFNFRAKPKGRDNNFFKRSFVALKEYANMLEWWDDIIEPISLKASAGTVRGGVYDYKPVTRIFRTAEDDGTGTGTDGKLYLEIQGRHSGGSGNRSGFIDAEVTINTTNQFFIFETEPQDLNSELFYETEETFDIKTFDDNYRFHQGNRRNQDLLGSATVSTNFFNCYVQGNGAESYRYKDAFNIGTDDLGRQVLAKSLNIDLRPSTTSLERYREVRRQSDITYSEPYNENSNINGLGVFNLAKANYKEDIEKKYGSIQHLHNRDTNLLMFQEDKVSQIPYGKDILYNADGTSNVATIDDVLGTQNPYAGEFGISRNPESVVVHAFNVFFTDAKRGAVCNLERNGIVEISMTGMRTFFKDEFKDSIDSKKLGAYDPYLDQYVLHIAREEEVKTVVRLNSTTGIFSEGGISDTWVFVIDYGLARGVAGYMFTTSEEIESREFLWDDVVQEDGISGDDFTFTFTKTKSRPLIGILTFVFLRPTTFTLTPIFVPQDEIRVNLFFLNNLEEIGQTVSYQYGWFNASQSRFTQHRSKALNAGTTSKVQLSGSSTGLEGTGVIPLSNSRVVMRDYQGNTGTTYGGNVEFGYIIGNVNYTTAQIQDLLDETSSEVITFPAATRRVLPGGNQVISSVGIEFERVVGSDDNKVINLIWDYRNNVPVLRALDFYTLVEDTATIPINVNGENLTNLSLYVVTIVRHPTNGSVTINETNGTLTYSLPDNSIFLGVFTYSVALKTNTDLSSNIVTITVLRP